MRVRFSTVLVVALLGMLTSTVALVAVTSTLNASKSAEALSSDVLAQVAARVDARVRSQLDVAVAQSVLGERLLSRGALSPTNQGELARYFLDAIAAQPWITYLSFSLEANGNHVYAKRTDDGGFVVRYLARQPDGALELSDYRPRGGQLERFHVEADKRENEPRPRPFYVAARAAHRPVWTETYQFFDSPGQIDSPGVTYATPVLSPDGALIGVLTADFDLRAISRFLGTLDVLEHGVAFIVEQRGDGTQRVIAHPSPDIFGRPRPNGDRAPDRDAMDAERVTDPRVVAMVRALPGVASPAKAGPAQMRFSVGDTAYVGGYQPLIEGNLRWTVCVVAPEDDILGFVRRSNRTTAWIVVGGVSVSIVVALLLGALLARPLRRLADETEAIGRLDLESSAGARSRFVEVNRLASGMEQMKRGLRSFRRYLPAELVHELLSSGREAEVGGERRTLTIHFSDIAGFTPIAEALAPEQLVAFLGDYLEAMTEPIHRSGGTVDKYIGDAIMAFWGAPRADASHALHACEAALENRDRLARLNDGWEASGRPRLDARAALHTGEVVVGNVGSRRKLDYTVIGDAVNLASRLEGLNKRYGTRLMISETTWALVREQMVARPLDRVSVKGKSRSVDVYELIGRRGEVSVDQELAAAAHAEAFAAYLERRWADAAAMLREGLAARPEDTAARVLLERCTQLLASPPGDDWDGSEKMMTK